VRVLPSFLITFDCSTVSGGIAVSSAKVRRTPAGSRSRVPERPQRPRSHNLSATGQWTDWSASATVDWNTLLQNLLTGISTAGTVIGTIIKIVGFFAG
jgi:hypothetical protein